MFKSFKPDPNQHSFDETDTKFTKSNKIMETELLVELKPKPKL